MEATCCATETVHDQRITTGAGRDPGDEFHGTVTAGAGAGTVDAFRVRRGPTERDVAKKKLITSEFVMAEASAGRKTIAAPRSQTIVTPGAWSRAHELGLTIDQSDAAATATPTVQKTPSAERVVGPKGLTLVRGASVKLAHFAGAGPDRDVRLADLITGRDGSPMTAGIMSWSREDSFPWSLDYDEVDLVLEGVLQLTLDGQTLEGRPGDVFFIPKGSQVRFGTPWRTKVFYVTYPADWTSASANLVRPQK